MGQIIFAALNSNDPMPVVISPEGTLRCPICGEDYLHHGNVTRYTREEDDPTARAVTITENGINARFVASDVSAKDGGNPSIRRGAIVIEFHCENCNAETEEFKVTSRLSITQHKGRTFIEWL